MSPIKIAGYLAHAETNAYRSRVGRTMELIAKHPDYGVSCSWGKDSLCVLHMALEVHGQAKAFHGRYSENEELLDIPMVRDAFLSRFPMVQYQEIPVYGDWEIYERAGRFFLEAESQLEKKLLSGWHRDLRKSLDDAVVASGAKGKMLGLAAHESYGRKMNISTRGDHYQTKDEAIPKLLPLADWSPKDVWAYMLSNDLPRLRIYDVAKDPERARSEFAFAVIGASSANAIMRHGAWKEWATAYPDLWRKWITKWPEMSMFCR